MGLKISVKLGLKLNAIGIDHHSDFFLSKDKDAFTFIKEAHKLGIDYFDTSPSYGMSEEWLGKYILSLASDQRSKITVSTKFGEHWDSKLKKEYVDHSLHALLDSLNLSLVRLGRIDILHLHKANPVILRGQVLSSAIDYARKKGIGIFGCSVDDLESARIVCESRVFSVLRIPYNFTDQTFGAVIDLAQAHGKSVVINHPLNMGWLLTEYGGDLDNKDKIINAFRFILKKQLNGVVLTDTKSIDELKEDIDAFKQAKRSN